MKRQGVGVGWVENKRLKELDTGKKNEKSASERKPFSKIHLVWHHGVCDIICSISSF